MKKLHGTGVALVTPFDETGAIDFKGLKKLLQHTAKGADYFVVVGTTGEAATLTVDETKQILSFIQQNNPKKLPIVYGIGGNDTQEVIREIWETDFSGIDAILSVSPYYNKPSQEGIYQHYMKLAKESPVPIIIYNVPGRTASNITAETTLRLAKASPKFIAVKEASGNLEQCMKIIKDAPKGFMLISGDDMLTVPLYAMGSVGVISVLANAFPTVFQKVKEYATAGKFDKATKEQFKLLDISGPMYEEGNPVGVKYLLSEMGVCKNVLRLPHVAASQTLQKKIKSLYEKIKTRKG